MKIKLNILNEGGNAVAGKPIRGDLALPVARQLETLLQGQFDCVTAPLGSVGMHPKDQTSGDLDIGIVLPFDRVDEVASFLKDKFNLDDTQARIFKGFRLLSILYPYNMDGVSGNVQADLFFTDNIKMCQFFHQSPDYTKGESDFKGRDRTLLLKSIAGCIPTGKQNTFFDNSDYPKDIWKYSLDDTGLKLVHQSFVGKKGQQIKSKHTIDADTQMVSDDPTYILHFLLGKNAQPETARSFESVWDWIWSDKFPYSDQRKHIKEKLLDYLKNYDNLDNVNDYIGKQ